jgi:corrinoid protein of di/trimethylamine methyltransferase
MDKEQILENLATAILEGDEDKARANAQEALARQMDPLEAVEQGLSRGMAVVGQWFENGEAYLPDLLIATETFKAAIEILQPEIEAQQKQMAKKGTVVIGTVRGDMHSIGKNIVATVLETNGYEVVDIGVDNPALEFIEQARKAKAKVIALSSLMTTTMPAQREVIETLEEMGLRDLYFVIVGGGPVNEEWADEIDADGYGETAIHAVELVQELLGLKK